MMAEVAYSVVLLGVAGLCLFAGAQPGQLENPSAQDLLIKSEVETAVSMLQAIFTKHQQGENGTARGAEPATAVTAPVKWVKTEIYFGRDLPGGKEIFKFRPKP